MTAPETALATTAPAELTPLGIERALALVEEAKSLPELQDIRDLGRALSTLARSRDASREVQNGAAEVTLRATRKMGEILDEQKKAGERATPQSTLRRGAPSTHDESTEEAATAAPRPPTLEELGIDKNLARRAQLLAKMPESKLETYVRAQKENPNGEITLAGALGVAASKNPHAASNVNDGDPEKNERFTPRALVEELHKEFNFTRDFAGHPKAPATEVIGRKRIWTREDDCFTRDWTGERGLGNWPFDGLVKFVPFAFVKSFTGEVEVVVQPMPATRTDQRFWREFIEPFRPDRGGAGVEVRFLSGDEREREGRTRYGDPQDPEGLDAGSAGFASAVVIFRGPFIRSPRVAPRGTIEEVIAGLRLGDDKGLAHLWRQALVLARGDRRELVAAASAVVDQMDGRDRAALARVGINALVDEATGYQDVRPKDDLHRQLRRERTEEAPPPKREAPEDMPYDQFKGVALGMGFSTERVGNAMKLRCLSYGVPGRCVVRGGEHFEFSLSSSGRVERSTAQLQHLREHLKLCSAAGGGMPDLEAKAKRAPAGLSTTRFIGEATDLGFRADSPRPTLVRARCPSKGCKKEFRFSVAGGVLPRMRLSQLRQHVHQHQKAPKAKRGGKR